MAHYPSKTQPKEAIAPVAASVTEVVNELTPVTEPSPQSGTIAASVTEPVGKASTPVQVDVVATQKAVNAVGQVYSATVQDLVSQIEAGGNGSAINVIHSIKAYMLAMAPGKMISPVDGARQQVLLFRSVQTAINSVDKDFTLLFATILKIVDDNSEGVFNARYIFRFTDEITLNPADRQAFVRIMNLITTAAPVAGRSTAIKQVDFTRTLEFSFTEEGKRKVLAFFNK
jgi:hypothetical protein